MENEIKKREVVSPKGLKPKKDHEIRAPKPMKEKKKRKEKRSRSENGRRTSVKELSRDSQRLPKARDPRGI